MNPIGCIPITLALTMVFVAASLSAQDPAQPPSPRYFRIQVVDQQTGRGVPLVQLETVNHILHVTDSNGLVAIHEPDLMGRRVYFFVRSHGYEFPKDGVGNAGTALDVQPDQTARIKMKRVNIAERLYRITGKGIYRDSMLLGEPTPLAQPLGSGQVAGQDSAFALPYRGRIHWFWGDTSRLSYPLGHFWMAGGVSELPGHGGLDPARGVDLRYFTGPDGFSRPVCRLGVERGMIWADTFATVADRAGQERLVCRYAHMESLQKMLSHGFAIFNDEQQEFERLKELDMKDRWRFPAQAHPIRIQHDGRDYLQFGEVFPTVRVPAELDCFTDLDCYEYFTCLTDGSTADAPKVQRDDEGRLHYRWQRHLQPMDVAVEQRLLATGQIQPAEARFTPADTDSGKRLRMHRGSVCWNEYRKCWVMIAGEIGGTSQLGEIWYAEAPEPTGPWRQATKIVTHDRYTFYNPVQHSFFDQDGGRIIYFEGTYTSTFSGNEQPTPRYEYNQIMYRLDLADPRLHPEVTDASGTGEP